MQTATFDPMVGRTLEGRYRILEPIASGGMSTVYAAVDRRLDRLVAVKVMSSALSADPAFSDRFAREARAAARLTHLNTVSVYDQGQESGPSGHHVFLVMELVEGRTLRKLLRERGRLSPAEAISIMEPVLSALSVAHRAGLVHHDVKPENILLSDEGVVKVADFGLARAVETDATSTRTGLMMGTVAYCAPEQISNGFADPRSDVYSAGVVLFELLTGQPPYQGESAMNVAYQHVHSRVPAPSSRVRGIPSEIDELVLNSTDSDPSGRPTDAGAFLAEIADVRAELALPVTPVPPRARPLGRAARSEYERADERVNGRAERHSPDQATTEMLHRAGRHDTAFVPRRGQEQRTGPVPRDVNAPPPPIVIPPPRRQPASPRTRRRRRALIATVLVLLLGVASGYGGWWFAAGRYSHVPPVVGTSSAGAVAALQDAGYKVSVQPGPEFDDTVRRGDVLRTQPTAGARAVRGSTVTVVLSAGPQMFTLPNVRGKTPDAARKILNSLATPPITVAPDVKQEPNDTVPEGRVIRTDPAAPARVRRGQVVTIYVSKGPPVIAVPTIAAGTPLHDAEQTLKHAHFAFKTLEVYSDQVDKGGVISVDPSDKARKFSEITITVSKGPQFVTIPSFGEFPSLEEVKSQLEALNLIVVVNQVGNRGNPGVAIIDPPSGASVPVGSTVTLTVV